MNIGNLVMINFFGEGYYSGNSESQTMIIEKSFYEDFKEEIDKYVPYFHELDGKHSEVRGNLTVSNITKENLGRVVASVMEDDHWPVSENLIWELDAPQEMLEKQDKVHETFENLCRIETVTKIYFDGEEV